VDQRVKIQILLSTFNSSTYLKEQIDSIIGQTDTDWELLVRDDGSTDDTLSIIDWFFKEYPGCVKLLPSNHGSRGAYGSFSDLLQISTAPYVMFCDHDDVWDSEKVADTIRIMEKAEVKYGSDTPLLVYTDLSVVDEHLFVLNPSCFDQQNIDPSRVELRQLLLQNVPAGCTMLLNRALVEKVGEIPKAAVMHDHWVALVASCFGKMIYLDKPTVLYRQHSGNFYGAVDYGWGYFLGRYREGTTAIRRRFFKNVSQVEAFLGQYNEDLSSENRELLAAFSALKSTGWLERRKILINNRIWKHGVRRNIGMFLVI
jgi:glycosyltransferase involved in cell wall biosynthesis